MQNQTTSVMEVENQTVRSNDTAQFDTRMAERIMLPILGVLSLYIAICTVVYQSRKHRESMKWTNRMCTVAGLSTFLAGVSLSADVYPISATTVICNVFIGLSNASYITNKALVFQLLWLRQKTLYDGAGFLFNKLKMAIIKFFQYAIVAVNVLSIFGAVYTWIQTPRVATARGCEINAILPRWLVTSVVFPFTIAQVVLMALILVPLIKRLRSGSRAGGATSGIESLVVRISWSTALCVVSDLVFLFFNASVGRLVGKSISYSFFPIVNTYNMLLNTSCVLLSFSDYKARLLLCKSESQN